ncbi:MAG: aspartate/glutamate racemase family protein, partial [Spirochaetales bacterium]
MSPEKDNPIIGILCWESGQVPRGLVQLESLVGNSTNPASYAYPIRFYHVKGANIQTILEKPDRGVLGEMIKAAKEMTASGIRAITTSCGFNAIFQNELCNALDVPVFSSSLLQVPLVQKIAGDSGEVCIITAKKAALKPEHLLAAGISRMDNLHIQGLETCTQWSRIFSAPDEDLDVGAVRNEVVGVAMEARRLNPG